VGPLDAGCLNRFRSQRELSRYFLHTIWLRFRHGPAGSAGAVGEELVTLFAGGIIVLHV
jgi:hypothetical protein